MYKKIQEHNALGDDMRWWQCGRGKSTQHKFTKLTHHVNDHENTQKYEQTDK